MFEVEVARAPRYLSSVRSSIPHSIKAKQEKGYICCVDPRTIVQNEEILDPNAPCGKYDGNSCGQIGGYAQVTSLCCGGGVGVVTCDGPGISLTHTLCPNSYSCFQHFGSHWKRDEGDGDEGDGDEGDGDEDGDGDAYAQCELAR
jgi:hypothetical protein